jgi:predicted dithiol-disulfide oxidoreductase (DUF899 family)
MKPNAIVSREEWLSARKRHLSKEKEFTRLRDELSRERRELPWVRVEKSYVFDAPGGEQSLSDLFEGRTQLVVYHFMFGPAWEQACKSCSFWADNFNGVVVHLNHRDVSLVAVSKAPLEKVQAFRERMGWTFKWVSSFGSEFNNDFQVSFAPEELSKGEVYYNYAMQRFPSEEAPGISVFHKNARGEVFHTYSCYSRGLDMLNVAYHYLDLVPKGRDEAQLRFSMEWVRHHDRYGD